MGFYAPNKQVQAFDEDKFSRTHTAAFNLQDGSFRQSKTRHNSRLSTREKLPVTDYRMP